jgi:subtilisin family serine protease
VTAEIVLIDSGIAAGHPHLEGATVDGVTLLRPDWREVHGFADQHGHGTAVAAAALRMLPGAKFFAIAVLDRDLRAPYGALAAALRAARGRGRVVCLPLGSGLPAARGPLEDAISALRLSGAIPVAPAHPRGAALWPGDLPSVVSASALADCPLADLFFVDGPCPRFATHGLPRPIDGRPPSDNFTGPSFAAAHVAARVAALLRVDPSLDFDGIVAALRGQCRHREAP